MPFTLVKANALDGAEDIQGQGACLAHGWISGTFHLEGHSGETESRISGEGDGVWSYCVHGS